jgi:hypothetical protein
MKLARSCQIFTAAVAALATLAPPVALAQPTVQPATPTQPATLIVRSIGAEPNAAVVKQVAAAQAIAITQGQFPGLVGKTPEDVATQLCGAKEDGYVDAAVAANLGKTPIVPGQPLGPEVYSAIWPACLKVAAPVTYTIRTHDWPTSIRLHFTGEFADGPGLVAYFAQSGAPYAARRSLQPGQQITLPYQTFDTPVLINRDKKAAFINDLKTAGGREIRITEATSSPGTIDLPFRGPYSAGAVQVTEADCVSDPPPAADGALPPKPYPYPAAAVANAWTWAAGTWANDVTIAIVDNGFLGVECQDGQCPARHGDDYVYSARFPGPVFAELGDYWDAGHYVGPSLAGIALSAVLYETSPTVTIDEISGHGTHVAGLALGGPDFVRHRGIFASDDHSRIKLAILAVANGTEALDPAVGTEFVGYMNDLKVANVVNMSLVIDATSPNAPIAAMRSAMIMQYKGSLFVVAAGNLSKDLNIKPQRWTPAVYGGDGGDANIMSVASVDADGKLSGFSNYGSHAVDIAAPGCRIPSWLDADSEAVPLSGTSQAAPLVSFTAALLKSSAGSRDALWLKNRIDYSGDLLADPTSRTRIFSQSQLNIPKTLMWRQDYVRYRKDGVETVLLGVVDTFSGMACDGQDDASFDNLKALKRDGDKFVLFATSGPNTALSVCSATLKATIRDAPNVLQFHAKFRVVGDQIAPLDKTELADPAIASPAIAAADLVEFIRAN